MASAVGKRLPERPPRARASAFVPPALARAPVNMLSIVDERDAGEMAALLDAHDRLLILGDLPGVGKTAALKAYAATLGKEAALFVVPTNKLKAAFVREGFRAVTLDGLLGL